MWKRRIGICLVLPLVLGLMSSAYGQWVVNVLDVTLAGTRCARAADIDNDGDLDIVASGRLADAVRWYEHTDTVWIRHNIDISLDGAVLLCVADLDNDNDIDVAVAGQGADAVVWYENTMPDTTWHKDTIGANIDGAHCICGGDIDNDDDIDIVAAGELAGILICYLNPAWTPDTIATGMQHPISPEIVDLDGDGDKDILAKEDSQVVWFEAPAHAKRVIGMIHNTMSLDVDAVDIDGDGDQDVIGAFCDTDDLLWYENVLPDSSWPAHAIDPNINWPAWICADDLDNDGDNDVVAAENLAGLFVWYENVLPDSSWIKRTIASSGAPCWVCTADINGDSLTDVVATDAAGSIVGWFENRMTSIDEKTSAFPCEKVKLLPTIFYGVLELPRGKACRVFDITGRVVEPMRLQPGIYFVEVDGKISQKVIKVR